MIITRAPLRIPLGGGGTDLPSYYQHREGALISVAINKYVYVTVNRRFERSIRISYSQTEIVDDINEIRHALVREALRYLQLNEHLEITTIADLPANTGMGSSSCFTVALLQALLAYKRQHLPPQELAELAFHIEREILNEPVGKQDMYLAAFGGITAMDVARDGKVTVTQHDLSNDALDDFDSNLIMFYTGIHRSASDVLRPQETAAAAGAEDVLGQLDGIKDIGYRIRAAFKGGDIRGLGALMDEHWQLKRRLSSKISNSDIDRWYDIARAHGAAGGKIMGAGGGGFFLFYCDGNRGQLRAALSAEGLREERFRIDWDGAKVLANL